MGRAGACGDNAATESFPLLHKNVLNRAIWRRHGRDLKPDPRLRQTPSATKHKNEKSLRMSEALLV
jgi:hypothetical protein